MVTCANCGRYMDYGTICGACKDNEKIKQNQEDIKRAIEKNAKESERAFKLAIEEGGVQRDLDRRAARIRHEELMAAEAKRLEETQKQTQILLEGQLTDDQAYQRGATLEAKHINFMLCEDGGMYWEVSNPYLIERLNVAYKNGADTKLAESVDVSKPDLEYMKEEAFGHGYVGSKNCSIVYLHSYFKLSPAKLDIQSSTGMIESINQDTGKVERQWIPVYATSELNAAYELGVQKYLEECNAHDSVVKRLEKINAEKKRVGDESERLESKRLFKAKIAKLKRIGLALTVIAIVVFGYFYTLPSKKINEANGKRSEVDDHLRCIRLFKSGEIVIYGRLSTYLDNYPELPEALAAQAKTALLENSKIIQTNIDSKDKYGYEYGRKDAQRDINGEYWQNNVQKTSGRMSLESAVTEVQGLLLRAKENSKFAVDYQRALDLNNKPQLAKLKKECDKFD